MAKVVEEVCVSLTSESSGLASLLSSWNDRSAWSIGPCCIGEWRNDNSSSFGLATVSSTSSSSSSSSTNPSLGGHLLELEEHTCVLYEGFGGGGVQMLVFGGKRTSAEASTDISSSIYAFDCRAYTWRTIFCPSSDDIPDTFPNARYGHVSVIDDHKLYIFFGTSNCVSRHKRLGDSWAFDLKSCTWEEIFPNQKQNDNCQTKSTDSEKDGGKINQALQIKKLVTLSKTKSQKSEKSSKNSQDSEQKRPGERYSSVGVKMNRSRLMILHGGRSGSGGQQNDTWIFSFIDYSWTLLPTSVALNSTMPEKAWGASGCVSFDDHFFYVYGGENGSCHNTLFQLDLDSLFWRKIGDAVDKVSKKPLLLTSRHQTLCSIGSNYLATYSGFNGSSLPRLGIYSIQDDQWNVFHLGPNNEDDSIEREFGVEIGSEKGSVFGIVNRGLPRQRHAAVFDYINGQLLIHGGYQSAQCMNDVIVVKIPLATMTLKAYCKNWLISNSVDTY